MSKRVTDHDIYNLHQVMQQLDFLTTVHLAARDYRVSSEALAAMFEGLKAPLEKINQRWSEPDNPVQMHVPNTSNRLDDQD